MGARRTVTHLFLSLLLAYPRFQAGGPPLMLLFREKGSPNISPHFPFSWDGLLFGVNWHHSLFFWKSPLPLPPGRLPWPTGSSVVSRPEWIPLLSSAHLRLYRNSLGKKNTAEPLFWFKMAQNKFKDSLNLSTHYTRTKPDQNQSMLWIIFIPSKQSRKVAERAKYCQSALMLNAPDELLFKESMVTPFVKGVIIS